MPVKEDYRSLTGQEKAAILVLSMGDDHAAHLFGRMDNDEIRELSQAMSSLGTISSDLVERIFVEFAEQVSGTGTLLGTYQSTERLLAKSLTKDRANAIMEEIRGPAGRTMWDKLGNVNEAVLANYLKNEYPQTVAVVLSRIKADHAARVLAQLPEDFSMEVVMRMLATEVVQKEVLDDVEQTLRTELMHNLADTQRRDANELMAEIFNNFDRSTESRFLTALEERSPEAAERIKALMFTFEDLAKLDPTSIQTLLRKFDKDKLARALKGASESMRELFFKNMSERASKILREDMEAMGPVRLRDVDEAQTAMVTLAKDLAAQGEIIMASNKGDDELIY